MARRPGVGRHWQRLRRRDVPCRVPCHGRQPWHLQNTGTRNVYGHVSGTDYRGREQRRYSLYLRDLSVPETPRTPSSRCAPRWLVSARSSRPSSRPSPCSDPSVQTSEHDKEGTTMRIHHQRQRVVVRLRGRHPRSPHRRRRLHAGQQPGFSLRERRVMNAVDRSRYPAGHRGRHRPRR